MPGRTLLDVFLKSMWEMNSFDALHSLFDSLGELLLSPHGHEGDTQERVYLSKTSPLGVFVRRARLEFDRMKFEDTISLWSSFIKYRAPTAQWTKRLAGLASGGVDAVAAEMGIQEGDDVYEIAYGDLDQPDDGTQNASLDDLDRILEFQLDRLQRFGDRVPENMRFQLRSMLASSSTVHRQAHLVQFFDAWKAGDYTSAFDNLHRYYDYAMQTREKIHYQYALLHMAILQADFGCFGEAIAAINETIATARESQDMTCLSFSLSWLNHMSKAYPKQMKNAGYTSMLGSERDALTFLKAKARESKMYNLLSATLLNEAKLNLSTMSQSGRYDMAITLFDSVDTTAHNKSLKFNQYLVLCIGIIKLKRAIRRSDWSTCSHLLATLKPSADPLSDTLDPELHFLLSETYIDYLVAKGDYAVAFTTISALAKSLKEDHADILQRISVLLMQADLFRKVGKPEYGFSVALRAASVAFKAKLMPSLWSAVGLLANILNALGECASARRLLEAVLPQSLENGDNMLSGTLYSHLGDSFMGLADPAHTTEARLQTTYVAKAELYIDRARECFKKTSYLSGECEQLVKKAIIAKLRGDEKLAEEWSQNHNRVWEEGLRSVEQI
ncbi:anaphase promoting complex subunit 5 [Curvularia kusanoi]|uniref:Anaphase-promoting complex subunit 5 n=1 Tax=Curvularia kusanoi TaxID=90978 RepID=A0A9P4TH31_CURKU|nr:anaphase promoting complex subunit 5 [Curvularia kusanoi]